MSHKIDYTIKANRIKALDKINSDCLKAFSDSGIKLSKDAIVDVNGLSIEISIRDYDKRSPYFGRSAFASNIRIYPKDHGFTKSSVNEISIGSCGAFTPEYKPAYWRVVHSANILKNWKTACKIVNTYCSEYEELSDEIRKQTKP